MRMHALICATLSGPAMAEVVSCDLSGVPVRFEIDRTQFAPALDAKEPTRRHVTTVTLGDAVFPAEPVIIGDVRGFWAEGIEGSDVMMIMQPDGRAVYSNPRAGERLTGICEVLH